MAVVRIVFPDKGAVKSAVKAAESVGLAKAATEIERIIKKERPGMAAELSAEEALRLSEAADLCVPRIRDILREKGDEARRLIEYDAAELARRRAQGDRIRDRVRTGE